MSRNLDNALNAQRERERLIREGNHEGRLAAEELSKSNVKPRTLNVPAHNWPDLAALENRHAELIGQWHTTKAELITAYHSLDVAITKDADAYALALREGKKDPGKTNEQHARKCIEGLERRLKGLADAARIVETEVNALAMSKHAEWSGQVEREYNAAVDKLLGSFRDWLASAPGVDLSEVKRLATLHDYVHHTDHANRAHTYGELTSIVSGAMGALRDALDTRPATVLHIVPDTAEDIEAAHDEWNASVIRSAGTHKPLPHKEDRTVFPPNAAIVEGKGTVINVGERVDEVALMALHMAVDTEDSTDTAD